MVLVVVTLFMQIDLYANHWPWTQANGSSLKSAWLESGLCSLAQQEIGAPAHMATWLPFTQVIVMLK